MAKSPKHSLIPLFLIFLLALSLRTFGLHLSPPTLSHDEIGYVYNAYSIAQTARDVNGRFLPLNFDTSDPKSPVPIYFTAPIIKLFGLNTHTARFPYAFVGSLNTIAIYFLTLRLTNHRRTALAAALILTLMPWHITLSRVSYEAIFAVFFLTTGLVLFLPKSKSNIQDNKHEATPKQISFIHHLFPKASTFFHIFPRFSTIISPLRSISSILPLLFASLSFILAYFSYHAAKIWFYPLLAILFLNSNNNSLGNKSKNTLKNTSNHKKNSFIHHHFPRFSTIPTPLTPIKIILLLTLLLPTLVFLYLSTTSTAASRFWDTTIFQPNLAAKQVNLDRRLSTAPAIIQKIFHNKATYYLNQFTSNFASVFSPDFLFTWGEPSLFYSIRNHGQLNPFDAILLLLGLSILLQPKKQFRFKSPNPPNTLIPLSLILISPLPVALSQPGGISPRAFLATIPLAIIAAIGTNHLLTITTKKLKIRSIFLLFFLLYLLPVLTFLNTYLFRYPTYAYTALGTHEQQITPIIQNLSPYFDHITLATQDPGILWTYAFYTHMQPAQFRQLWHQRKTHSTLQISDLLTFTFDTQTGLALIEPTVQDPRSLLILHQSLEPTSPADRHTTDPVTGANIWHFYTHPQNQHLLETTSISTR